MPDTQTTADLDALPPLTDAMTARDLAAHKAALIAKIGAQADVWLEVGRINEEVHIGIYPQGISRCSSTKNGHIYEKTWPEAITAARAWIATYATVHRDNRIRAMALAIIDLTDQHGRCDRAMLTRREFSAAEVDDLKDAACVRASEMSANAPFVVEG